MSDTPIYDALVREFQWYAMTGRYVMPVLTPVQEWQARQRITNYKFDPEYLKTQVVYASRPPEQSNLDMLDAMLMNFDVGSTSLKRFAERYLRRPIKWDDPEEFRR